MKITVLGAGAWGTAIAHLLSDSGHQITLWCHEAHVAANIKEKKINEQFLPGIKLSPLIEPTTDLSLALRASSYIFLAIPVVFLRSILAQAKESFLPTQTWVILSKGIEHATLMLPSQIVDDVFGCHTQKAVLMGPSFARDLSERHITAVTLATHDLAVAQSLQEIITTPYFRPYTSSDVIGVQVGGIVKNVIALMAGILEGAGMTSDNTRSYIITLGLKEMMHIAVALGGRQETIFGLSGVGDLILTATGKSSKNLSFGKELGKGTSFEELRKKWITLPEGVNSVQSIHQIIQKHSLEMPICAGVYAIIFQNKTVALFINDLMKRPLERDCD